MRHLYVSKVVGSMIRCVVKHRHYSTKTACSMRQVLAMLYRVTGCLFRPHLRMLITLGDPFQNHSFHKGFKLTGRWQKEKCQTTFTGINLKPCSAEIKVIICNPIDITSIETNVTVKVISFLVLSFRFSRFNSQTG